MDPIPSTTSGPAGVVVAGFGGTGMTVVDHLFDRFGAEALEALGIELIGLDSIRDDPRRLIPPRGAGIDTGSASTSFIPVPTDHVAVLTNIAEGRMTVPYVTQAEAALRLGQPRISEGGFGTDPVCGALAFDAAPDRVIDQLVRRIESVATAANRPVQIVLVGGLGGGTGASMLARAAARLRTRLRDGRATVWVIGIMAGPFEPRFGGDDVFSLRARSLAATRELMLLPDRAADLVFVADHLAAIGDCEPLDGALSSVATFIELMSVGVSDIHGRSADWAGRDLRDTSLRERMGVVGAAAVRGEPHVWLDLVAQETAEQVAQAINTPGDHTDADARTFVERLISTFTPLRHASEIRLSEPSRPAAAIDPALSSSATILANLSAGEEQPPLPADFDLTLGRGRLHRETVTSTTDRVMADDLAEAHAWGRAENQRAANQLQRSLHALLSEALGGSADDGLNLNADPDVLVMLDGILSRIQEEFSAAARRVADDFEALTADPDQNPVRLADAARSATEEQLPDVSRHRQRAPYLRASVDLREARSWEVAVGDLRAGFELLNDVLDRVRRLVLGARGSMAEVAAAAREGAALARRLLTVRHARYDTRIVPTPDDEGVRRMRELFHQAGSPDRPVVEDILADLRIRFTGNGDDTPETWRLDLRHPHVTGFDDTAGAIATASRGQILPVDPRLLPAMARERFAGVVARLSLADQIGIELERPDRLGPAAPRLPDSDVAEGLRPLLDELVSHSGPLARIAQGTLDGREDRDPAPQELVFRPSRSATGLTVFGQTVQRVLDSGAHTSLSGSVAVDWPILGRLTATLRVSDSRLRPLNESLRDYQERAATYHTSGAARRAFELERLGTDLRLLDGRLLIPEVVRLLGDEETLVAAGTLLAMDKIDTVPDPDQPDGTRAYSVTVPRLGESVVERLGSVNDPEAAILAVLAPSAHGAAAVIRSRWNEEWQELVRRHGDDGARQARRKAVKDLERRLTGTERARDLFLALLLLIIDRDSSAGHGSPAQTATSAAAFATVDRPAAPSPAPLHTAGVAVPPEDDPRINPSVNPQGSNGSVPYGSFS